MGLRGPTLTDCGALVCCRWGPDPTDNTPSAPPSVTRRHGTADQVRWFEAKPCYIYHVVNAWEEGDEIVMDACRVKNPQHQTTFNRLSAVERGGLLNQGAASAGSPSAA